MVTSTSKYQTGSKVDGWLLALGFTVLGFCSYLLFFYHPELGTQGISIVGHISPKGVVRRRVARRLHWDNVSKPAPLYLRDIIYAPKNAGALVELTGGRKIELLPDSMIQLDEVTGDNVNITLIEGEVKGHAAIVVKKQVKFRMPSYPTRGARTLASPTAIDFCEMRFTDLTRRLKDSESKLLRLPIKRVLFRKPMAIDKLEYFKVDILRPNDMLLGTREWIDFAWTPVPLSNMKYVIEISRNADFSNFLTHPTKSTRVRLQIEEPGTYYWRVRSQRDKEIKLSTKGEFKLMKKGRR